MKKIQIILLIVSCFVMNAAAQNLVQNPGFENLPTWDSLWFLSTTAPSSPTAVATQIITDAHEGTTSVELSNTVNTKWTYYYTDSTDAPLSFLANKSYEVKSWMRSTEEAKQVDFSIFWNGSLNTQAIYSGNPNPVSDPDWFMVKDTITPTTDFVDGYLRLGLRATKNGAVGAGKLLFDDFSVIRIPDNTETDITAFSIPEQAMPASIYTAIASIVLEVPSGTDVTAITPGIVTLSRGAVISPGHGIAQNFSIPVVYTVTAQDETTTRDWTVTLLIQPNTETDIIGFSFIEEQSPALIDDVNFTIDSEVLFGTDLTSLSPSVSVSYGATVNPDSGVVNDFTNPVIYTVTAEDGISIQDWIVTVTEALPNTENDILTFILAEQMGPATIDSINHTVDIDVPYGTDPSNLIPTIQVSWGATINPASGVTGDFSVPATYTVTAQDSVSIQDWEVTIHVLPNTENDILTFILAEQVDPATIDSINHTVDIDVPYGTDPSNLVPTIVVSGGAIINPGSGVAGDFSVPATYTVTAQDSVSIQDWEVTIHVLLNTENDILTFILAEQTRPSSVNKTSYTVEIEVWKDTDVTALTPSITVSPGATINPANEEPIDFTNEVDYTVTAEDGITSQIWTITVTLDPAIGIRKQDLNRPVVFPNPATETVFLNLEKPATIKVTDIAGKIIYIQNDVAGNRSINVADYASGTYYIHIEHGGISFTQKLIIL